MTSDQKRALGIGGVAVAGLLVWRHLHPTRTTAAPATPVTTTGSIAPYTPQAPLPLQPGESVYDPNSQALLSTPQPIDTASPVAGPGNQSVTAAAPSYSVNVTYPQTVRMVKPAAKPAKRRPSVKAKPKVVKR